MCVRVCVYLSFSVSVLSVYTRSMCEMWKSGSSLDGSGGFFTSTSFRNRGCGGRVEERGGHGWRWIEIEGWGWMDRGMDG